MGLGRGPQTDILAVSFSTTDAVGHRYGPDSRELHDQIVRLDKYMGMFIDSLYKIRDSTRIVFALTADHGVAPYPELRAAREHTTAARTDVFPTVTAVNQRIRAKGGDSISVRFFEGIVTINRDAVTKVGLKPDSILDALAKDMRKLPGVGRVDWVKDLARADTSRDAVARRWLHMLPADLPADLVMSLAPYAYYSTRGHGDARHAERLRRARAGDLLRPAVHAGQVQRDRALVADMAPTLAAVVDVKPMEPLDGKARVEAIRKQSPYQAGRSRRGRAITRLPRIVVPRSARMTSSVADSGTSTNENRSAISMAPMSRESRPASLAIAPTRSPGRTPAFRPSAM